MITASGFMAKNGFNIKIVEVKSAYGGVNALNISGISVSDDYLVAKAKTYQYLGNGGSTRNDGVYLTLDLDSSALSVVYHLNAVLGAFGGFF